MSSRFRGLKGFEEGSLTGVYGRTKRVHRVLV